MQLCSSDNHYTTAPFVFTARSDIYSDLDVDGAASLFSSCCLEILSCPSTFFDFASISILSTLRLIIVIIGRELCQKAAVFFILISK